MPRMLRNRLWPICTLLPGSTTTTPSWVTTKPGLFMNPWFSGDGLRQDELDGITVEFGDLGDAEWWWFNVRASNTEPLIRLNLEAATEATMQQRRDEILDLIRQ